MSRFRLVNVLIALTVVLEVGYLMALFSAGARRLLVPGVIAMLVGIRVLLGPTFGPLVLCHVFWVPWCYPDSIEGSEEDPVAPADR